MHLLFQSSNLSSFGFAAGRWLGFAWPGSGSAWALPPALRSAVPRFAQEKIWNSSACLALCLRCASTEIANPDITDAGCGSLAGHPEKHRCFSQRGPPSAQAPCWRTEASCQRQITLEKPQILAESGKGPSLWCVSLSPLKQ